MSSCCFAIRARKNAGRALVSVRNLQPQELIVSEKPFIVSPILSLFQDDENSNCICANCFKFLRRKEKSRGRCRECETSICDDRDCLSRHSCQLSKKLNNYFKADLEPAKSRKVAICLAIFAMMRFRRKKDEKISNLMTRPSQMPMKAAEEAVFKAIVDFGLRTRNGDVLVADSNSVDDAIGVFTINGVKVQRHGEYPPCVAVYPTFSSANHACIASAAYDVDAASLRLELRSRLALRANREITVSYLSPLTTTRERQASAVNRWGFRCECARCADPTELGTYAGAVKCVDHAEDGSWACLLIDNGDDYFICEQHGCKCRLSVDRVGEMLNDVKDKMAPIMTNEAKMTTLEKVMKAEEVLNYTDTRLGPNHCLILNIEYKLIVFYAQLEKEDKARPLSPLTTRPMRERRIQICLHLLEIGARVDPGATAWRGVILQAMVLPWLHLAKADFAAKIITKRQFQMRVAVAMRATNESTVCLREKKQNDISDF